MIETNIREIATLTKDLPIQWRSFGPHSAIGNIKTKTHIFEVWLEKKGNLWIISNFSSDGFASYVYDINKSLRDHVLDNLKGHVVPKQEQGVDIDLALQHLDSFRKIPSIQVLELDCVHYVEDEGNVYNYELETSVRKVSLSLMYFKETSKWSLMFNHSYVTESPKNVLDLFDDAEEEDNTGYENLMVRDLDYPEQSQEIFDKLKQIALERYNSLLT